jgi:hypothetical protein
MIRYRHFGRRIFVMVIVFIIFLLPIAARAIVYAIGDNPRSWRDADWSSTGMLPPADEYAPARVVVFTGKAGA